MQIQNNPRRVIEEETEQTEVINEKPLRNPPKSKSIHQRIKLEYTNNKRLSKPNLPHVLKPSKLLLPTHFSKSCLLQFFGSRNTLDCIRQASPASFDKSPKLHKFQNTRYTLKMCGLRLGTHLASCEIALILHFILDYSPT